MRFSSSSFPSFATQQRLKLKRKRGGFMQLGISMKLGGSLNGERRLISFKNQFLNVAERKETKQTDKQRIRIRSAARHNKNKSK